MSVPTGLALAVAAGRLPIDGVGGTRGDVAEGVGQLGVLVFTAVATDAAAVDAGEALRAVGHTAVAYVTRALAVGQRCAVAEARCRPFVLARIPGVLVEVVTSARPVEKRPPFATARCRPFVLARIPGVLVEVVTSARPVKL